MEGFSKPYQDEPLASPCYGILSISLAFCAWSKDAKNGDVGSCERSKKYAAPNWGKTMKNLVRLDSFL